MSSADSATLQSHQRSRPHYWAIFGTTLILTISGGLFFWSNKNPNQTAPFAPHARDESDGRRELMEAELLAKVLECEDKGNNDEIIRRCSEWMEKNPNSHRFLFYSAEAKHRKQDFDGAISDYTRAIALSPKNPKYYNLRGFVRGDKGDMNGAIADISMAIELSPNNAELYLNRGLAKGKNGDDRGAIPDFTRAIEIEPTMAAAYKYRSIARQATGDVAGAKLDFMRLSQLNQK